MAVSHIIFICAFLNILLSEASLFKNKSNASVSSFQMHHDQSYLSKYTSAIGGYRQLSARKLTIQQIEDAIKKAKSVLSLIHGRYEYDTPRGKLFVTMQSNMKKKDFYLIKLIFLKKLTSKIPKFKMVFGGSSVTAGHDSLFLHSHPKILESRMRPIFEALGVEFEVDSIAQGGNNCSPSNMCYDARAGEGGDFYLWEQSFNCGRDYGFVEMIVRLAARNEASVYIMSSGGVDTKKCAPSKEAKPLRSDVSWEPARRVHFSDAAVIQLKNDLVDVNKLGQSMGTSGVELMTRYPTIPAASGMNVLFSYPKNLCNGLKPELKVCDVPSLMEGCFDLKFLSKETSDYGFGEGAPHHPGRAMYMMRGELITWSYTIALLEALFALRGELTAKKPLSHLNVGYATKLTSLYGPLPEPLLCGGAPFYCKMGYNCATDYSPRYTDKFLLTDLMVKTEEPTRWNYTLFPIDRKQIDRVKPNLKEMRKHFGNSEGPGAGEIFFRVNIVSAETAHVIVCLEGIDKKNPMARLEYRFDLNVGDKALSPDFVYVPKSNRSVWESKSDLNNCMSLNNLPLGVHVLGLTSKGGYTGVSHIITWKV